MLPFLPSFTLQEAQGIASLQAICEASASQTWDDEKGYVALTYPETRKAQADIVGELIRAIVHCSKNDIPLLLNRTGDALDPKLPPKLDLKSTQTGFQLGLQTSGTTGNAKWVFSQFDRLLPRTNAALTNKTKYHFHVWLLCYHPFSFAGLQVILQALISGNTLCVFPHLSVDQLAQKALETKVSAISATPSLFRSLNLTWGANKPQLQRLSLGGEIATQSILDEAKADFPNASLRHIYATTESGVLFSVKDALSGFPELWIGQQFMGWTLSIENQHVVLHKANLRVHTGDRISIANGRCQFAGRSDNIINVGGAKVDALALETDILALEAVIDARVFAKPNPIVGNVVGVEILSSDKAISELAFRQWKRQLPSTQQPRLIKWVDHISLSDTGKKLRVEQ